MRSRIIAAVAAALLPALLALGAAPAHANGNSGTLKISEPGAAADHSNNPHVGCSFDVQWWGFAAGTSTVTFESWEPTGDATVTKTAGSSTVMLANASGGTMNTRETYTLAFDGTPHPNQGFKVRVTATTYKHGQNKAQTEQKMFWVDCDGSDTPTPPDPQTPETPSTPQPPAPPTPPTSNPGTSFDWNWQYPNPTCDALTVTYPADLPAGQSNDANVRFQTATGSFTLNFHNNTGTWSGTHVFDFKAHPQWPAGLTTYHVVWVQVGGTNYHWEGDVSCAPPPVVVPDPEKPFDWNWEYPDPTCTALTVGYPSNIPSGQANDANIRFESNIGQFTLNFHNNTGTWSGTHVFDYLSHPSWPAGVTTFRVVWTQVGGTNYHWQGDVECVIEDGTPKAVTNVAGFRTGSVSLKKGAAVAGATVIVEGSGFQDLVLQKQTGRSWTDVKTVSTDERGAARVTFPKLTKKGTHKFRLQVPGSGISTGTSTGTLAVRVR